jgi:hypothetical protein
VKIDTKHFASAGQLSRQVSPLAHLSEGLTLQIPPSGIAVLPGWHVKIDTMHFAPAGQLSAHSSPSSHFSVLEPGWHTPPCPMSVTSGFGVS